MTTRPHPTRARLSDAATRLATAALLFASALAAPAAAPAAPPEPTSPKARLVDYIRVRVNNEVVTNLEVLATVDGHRQRIVAQGGAAPADEELLRQTIDSIVGDLLVLDRAKQIGVEVGQTQVDEQVERMLEEDPALAESPMMDQVRDQVYKDLLKRQIVEREVESRVTVSDDEVGAFCREGEGALRELGVAQILLRRDLAEARRLADEVKFKLLEGRTFFELAQTYSDDPRAKESEGRLGYFRKGQLLPAIDEAAFSMPTGGVSDLIQSEFGFHIVTTYLPPGEERLDCANMAEPARARIHNQLYDEKRRKMITTYLENLRSKAEVVIQ